MSNLPNIDFIDTNAEATLRRIVEGYENASERKLSESDPIMLFLKSIAYELVILRNEVNYTGKQNLLAYAEGEKLDHLGNWFDVERNQAKSALTTLKFSLTEIQPTNIIIPLNSKVSDSKIIFQTTEVAEIVAGSLFIEVGAEAVVPGDEANGILPDRIVQFIDVIPYVTSVTNITETAGGANTEPDESYKNRIKLAPSSFSVAGPYGAYQFWALSANQNIAYVSVVNKEERTQDTQFAGVVEVYPLMRDGTPAPIEVLNQVAEVLNDKKRRPLTDKVETLAPAQIDYDIDLKYYLDKDDGAQAPTLQTRILTAVNEFIKWQSEKMGRDINPSELVRIIMDAGAKRVDLISPTFQPVEDYEVANNISINVVFDGFEQ